MPLSIRARLVRRSYGGLLWAIGGQVGNKTLLPLFDSCSTVNGIRQRWRLIFEGRRASRGHSSGLGAKQWFRSRANRARTPSRPYSRSAAIGVSQRTSKGRTGSTWIRANSPYGRARISDVSLARRLRQQSAFDPGHRVGCGRKAAIRKAAELFNIFGGGGALLPGTACPPPPALYKRHRMLDRISTFLFYPFDVGPLQYENWMVIVALPAFVFFMWLMEGHR
jgi:hypothetical protein